MMGPRAASVRALCHLCEKSFSRQEHLNRHLLSHSNERPYRCSKCRKRFARTDILSRHQAAHHSDDIAHAVRRTIGAGFRACLSCAAARVKCSGSDPCGRCSTRGIECNYPLRFQKTADAGEYQQLGQIPANDELDFLTNHTSNLSSSNNEVRGEEDNERATFETLRYSTTDAVANTSHQGAHISISNHQDSIASNGALTYNVQSQAQDLSNQPIMLQDTPIDPYDFSMSANQDFQEAQFSDFPFTSINWLSPIDYSCNDLTFDNTSLEVFATQPMLLCSNPLPSTDSSMRSIRIANENSGEPNEHLIRSNRSRSQVSEISHTSVSPRGSASLSSVTFGSRSTARYVDGAGARDARYGKLKKRHPSAKQYKARIIDSFYHSIDSDLSFPSSLDMDISASQCDQQHLFGISPCIYEKIFVEFKKHCIHNSHPFNASHFPTVGVFHLGIRLYFEYFQDVYPILHKSSILNCQDENAFVVFIAISSIGIKYLGTSSANKCSEAWLEFLSRVIEHVDYQPILPGIEVLSNRSSSQLTGVECYILQGQIIATLGMFNSCSESLVQRAFDWRAKLVNRCLKMELLLKDSEDSRTTNFPIQKSWASWVLIESKRRVGYFIWLLDTIIAYQSDYRPQLLLTDAKASLPCHEDFWAIMDHDNLQEMQTKFGECPSLLSAIEALYKNKFVDSNLGDFGRTVLIHGLYRRTWEVASYHANTLSSWTPSAPGTGSNCRSDSEEPEDWLPGIATFAKWRNSACDCLDVLHWEANSKVAQMVGVENPLLLHLHLARLILLTPATTIQEFATDLIRHSKTTETLALGSLKPQLQKYRKEIVRWFLQDQYKSRLSLVHAGAIFWHVRRYSHDSFLQPFAVFLSTLVIWAYATSFQALNQPKSLASELNRSATRNPSRRQLVVVDSDDFLHQETDSDIADSMIDSPYINLDRPCDDELIQTFVRHGTKMTGYMAGIGNINQIGSAVKILREGVKILLNSGTKSQSTEAENNQPEGAIPTWRMATKHAVILEELAELRNTT